MRRRRVARRPFARLYYANGRSSDHADDSRSGAELFVAAGRLIEVAGKRIEIVSELFDPALAERVLARALANGGRFAELFAERRHGFSLSIDESRIESVQSGAEEGAGVRVIEGGTSYFAHVDGLDPADLERAADEAAAALRGERRDPLPLAGRRQHAAADRAPARGGRRRAQGRAAARARRARPRVRAARSPSSPPPTPRRGARSRSPTPTGC